MSVRVLLSELAGVRETVLLDSSTGGRPRARRMLTEMTMTQQRLYEIIGLGKYAPARQDQSGNTATAGRMTAELVKRNQDQLTGELALFRTRLTGLGLPFVFIAMTVLRQVVLVRSRRAVSGLFSRTVSQERQTSPS